MEFTYRTASRSDLPGILSLYRQLSPDDVLPDFESAESIWAGIEARGGIRYFVAEDSGRIVASCSCAIIPNLTRGGKSYAVVENVITDSAYRRRGIGTRLMERAVRFARNNNCYKIILLSSSRRIEAHEFYKSIGFNGNSKKGFEMRFDD